MKMGTSFCYVTVTLKGQENIVNLFFLNKDIFSARKCMFDIFKCGVVVLSNTYQILVNIVSRSNF